MFERIIESETKRLSGMNDFVNPHDGAAIAARNNGTLKMEAPGESDNIEVRNLKHASVNTDALTKVHFHYNTLTVIENNGIHYVAVDPISAALGLDWNNERRSICCDSSLKPVIVCFQVYGKDGKVFHFTCIPVDMVQGWLFTINPDIFPDWRRRKIKLFRDECFKVLAKHCRLKQMSVAEAIEALRAAYKRENKELQNAREQKRLIETQLIKAREQSLNI